MANLQTKVENGSQRKCACVEQNTSKNQSENTSDFRPDVNSDVNQADSVQISKSDAVTTHAAIDAQARELLNTLSASERDELLVRLLNARRSSAPEVSPKPTTADVSDVAGVWRSVSPKEK